MNIKVKKLDWVPHGNFISGRMNGRTHYTIMHVNDGWRVYGIEGPSDGGALFESEEVAKSSTQGIFEQEIIACLYQE